MTSRSEPRFFRIAAAMADPSRARMLATLLGGEYRSAGELAAAAGITLHIRRLSGANSDSICHNASRT